MLRAVCNFRTMLARTFRPYPLTLKINICFTRRCETCAAPPSPLLFFPYLLHRPFVALFSVIVTQLLPFMSVQRANAKKTVWPRYIPRPRAVTGHHRDPQAHLHHLKLPPPYIQRTASMTAVCHLLTPSRPKPCAMPSEIAAPGNAAGGTAGSGQFRNPAPPPSPIPHCRPSAASCLARTHSARSSAAL